ncbi:MAG: protein kinase domain-containing protein [Wenzhouxiangella sp.]
MSQDESTRRYQQAKALAMAALELPAEQRQAYLDETCAGDPALRDEAGWLLSAAEDDSADEAPEQFQAVTRQAVQEVSLTIPLPRDYRLIRRLNEGGMGVVYLAQRADGESEQQVALKMLNLGDAPEDNLARRFATERRILSRLNHPYIAHLIDGGLTAEGRPFLATEFVDGDAIDQWCARPGLDRADKLRLFVKVCDAVDYAHRQLVIHRDLKPSNILVTADGQPKLLDFGIAHLLDGDDGDDPAPSRQRDAEQGALSLPYASPEQLRGEALSTATDVYSLGVLLQELLTGSRPSDGEDNPADRAQAILEGRLAPPLGLPHDLVCILQRALALEPNDRYRSVRAFSDDLTAYLDSRPVDAREGGAIYRLRRHAWRHRWSVAASLGLAALLVTFLVDREAQLQRIAWERDRAEAVTAFIDELFAGADSLPSRGNEVTVRELLDLGHRQLGEDPPGNPAVDGSIALTLGRAYNALGLGEQALPLLTDARTLMSAGIGPLERARLQAQIGAALDSAGRAVEAIAADELAIALYRDSPPGQAGEVMDVRIRQLRNRANVLDQPLERSIAGLNALLDEIDQSPDDLSVQRFEALAALVAAYVAAGQAELAMATARQALVLAEQLYPDGDPRQLRGRHVFATAVMLSEPERAVSLYRDLLADHQRLIGPSQRMANTMGNLGVALSRAGQPRESLAAFRQAADMIEQVAGRDHYLYRLSLSNLAALHLRLDEPDQAEQLIRQLIPVLEERSQRYAGVETIYLASALDVLGSSLGMQGRYDEAIFAWQQALALLGQGNDAAWPSLGESIEAKIEAVSESP